MSELKKLENSHVGFEITLTEEQWNIAWDKAVEEASKHLEVEGFRKGHAPATVVVEKIGKDRIQQEALAHAFQPIFTDFIKKHELETVAMPHLDVKSWEPTPTVSCKVAVMPEVDLSKAKKVKVKPEPVKVDDKKVEETIDNLRKRFVDYKEVLREAKKDDKVEVDFEGKDKDGVVIDQTVSKNHPAILGAGHFVKEFEDNLYGKKAGEEADFIVKFPDDYHGKVVAGKEINFHIKVNKVMEPSAPNDDDLAKKALGVDMKIADFKERVKKDLTMEAERLSKQKTQEKVFEELIKATNFDLPKELIEEEYKHIRHEQEQALQSRGIALDNYLENMKLTPEKYEEQLRTAADRNVRIKIILDKLRKEDNIGITKEEKEEIEVQAEKLPEKERAHFKNYQMNNIMLNKLISPFIS